jgi:hypothetical protein
MICSFEVQNVENGRRFWRRWLFLRRFWRRWWFDPISVHASNSGHGSMFGLVYGHYIIIGRISIFGLIYRRPIVGGLTIEMTLPSRHANT